jgi:hypothetical protein
MNVEDMAHRLRGLVADIAAADLCQSLTGTRNRRPIQTAFPTLPRRQEHQLLAHQWVACYP